MQKATMHQEQPTPHVDDHTLLQDQDDAELETLSLCDLPLYSDEYDREQELHHLNLSPNIDHGDPFEFSSVDVLSASGSKMCMADDIIFCGRLIPYGRGMPSVNGSPESWGKIGGPHKPKKKKWKFFKWKFSLFRKHRHCSSKCRDAKLNEKSGSQNESRSSRSECLPLEKYRYVPEKCTDKCNFSMRRLSATSGRVKCRWYLLMFGSATRFPIGMELEDMKMRQSRRKLSSTFRSFNSEGGSIGRGRNCDGKGNWNWGLWRLLRALSCSSSPQCGSDGAIMKSS